MAREVYDELRGSNQKLSLQQFIQWEDVQELLDSGAVSRDDLADCIEKSGANIEDDSESTIEFETVRIVVYEYCQKICCCMLIVGWVVEKCSNVI